MIFGKNMVWGKTTGHYDALVVLGSVLRGDTEIRASRAAKLFENGCASIVILVGTRVEVGRMRSMLINAGIPRNTILQNDDSVTTVDNAYYAKLICKDKKFKRLAIVVSELQATRSLLTFRKLFGRGYTIACFPCPTPRYNSLAARESVLSMFVPLLEMFRDGDHQIIKDSLDMLQKAYDATVGKSGIARGLNLSLKNKQSELLESL